MIQKIEGIIISETPYKESSKIVNIYTKDKGIIGVICKGAKSMKSKLRAVSTKFTYGFFHVYYKENKLSTLIEVDIINNLDNIKTDLLNISYLNYITELVTQVYKQSREEDIYNYYVSTILKINDGLNPVVMTNILEIKLLDFLGVGLNLESCVKCGDKTSIINIDPDLGGYVCSKCNEQKYNVNPKTIKMIRMYYFVEINSISKLDISEEVIKEIDYFLNKYYERYTGLYLYSKGFLKSIV